MMTPLGFEVVANQTELTLRRVTIIKWPVSRNMSGIRQDDCQIAPKTKEEEYSH